MQKLLQIRYFWVLLIMLLNTNLVSAQCPAAGSTFWFASPADGPFDTTQPLGSFDNPLTDWNSGTPSVLEAITDCPGPIVVNFRSCYYNTDGSDGDVNWVQENLQNNVTFNGNGALLENLSASSKWLVIGDLDNIVINDITLTGYNGTDGAAIGIYASTNVVLNNVEFNANPTTTALHIDAGDNFTYGFGDASVEINNCLFANNPPGAETVSTGALEIQNISSGNHIVDVDINNTVFSCNKRAGFGGAIVSTNDENSPGATINLDIIGCTFSNNLAFGTAGEGGGLYASGEEHFINIDGTTFTCNEAQATTGTGSGGGAIRIWDGPNVTISNSIFYGNMASTVSGDGGAISYSSSGPTGPFTITNSSFINNTAADGGGIWADEPITLTGGFFSGNTPDDFSGGGVTDTDGGASNTTGDPGITACDACPALPSVACDASASDLALTCPYFCSTGVPPAATGDADLTIDMSNFVQPTCTNPLDYTYTFLVVDAAGNVVCEFDATDNDTQDPNATPPFSTTIAGTPDGIPDAMDPAVQQANLCAGLAPGDYTIVGFHYLTADAPPIVTPFVGQMLTDIQNYLTDPPTSPAACGALGTATPFTILEPIEVTITTSCPAVPDGTYLADITITGGYPLKAGAGAYTLTTNFGTTTYTFGTPIIGQAIPAGQSVDVTVAADGNGANGTTPPGPLCFDCMATIVSEPEPVCQACPDIIDGTLSASIGAASAMDVCSGDAVTVCVDVDLTNDPTAMVEFSNDGGATWTVGVPDMAAVPVTTHTVNIVSAAVPYDVSAGPYYVGDVVNYQASGTHPIEIIDPSGAMVVTGVTASGSFTVTTAGNYTFDCLNPGHPAMFNTVEFLPRPIPSEFCFDFTEINTTSCDPLMVSYQAQFNMASLADMSCDLDLQTMDATPEVVTVNVYPDVATLANAMVAGDGTCGPSLTQDCANFTVTNDYDTNGANPDFASEMGSGNIVFTITNPAAPTACQTTTVPATFDCSVPGVTMDKNDADDSDDTQEVASGGTATFTITVTNSGTEDLCNVVVTDPNGLNCEMTYTDNGGTLAVGDTWTYTCTQANVTAPFTNTATVNAEGCTSGTMVDDMDDSDVTVAPEITIVKDDADNTDDTQEVANGGTATFTITVTNSGTEDLCNVSVTDPNGLSCEMTYTDNGGTLAVGDTWTYTCTQTNVTAAFTNTATVNGEGCTSGTLVDDEDDSEVTLEATVPSITMDKDDADDTNDTQEVASGGTATFTITVTNNGTEDLCNVNVTDPNGLNCEMTYTDNGGTLVVGDTWTYTCTQADVTMPFANTATVNAEGCTSGTAVNDTDVSDVTVAPEITIVKDDADNTDDTQEVPNDGTATFTITVTNNGTEDLCNVVVTDPNGLNCEMTYTDNGGTLAIGDTWTYTCTQTNVTTAFTNTATVNAEGCTSGTTATDEDDSDVTLEPEVPSVTMDKNDADNGDDTQEVASGGTATFTITVTNNGTEDLCNVSVTDPNGLNCEMTYTDNGGTLAVGDTWTYTCTQTVTTAFTNTATVNAEGCTSGTMVNDMDDSDVTLPPEVPSITIDKDDADNTDDTQMVVGGGTATFTITVTNNGTEDLCNVMITDPNSSGCVMTYTDNGGTLAVGDTWTYTCTQENVTDAFINTAVVSAEGCTSGTMVNDMDDSEVIVDQPSVSMDKNDGDNGDDTQQVEVDGTATFTITVTNNGMEDLCNVSVVDPDGASCEMTYTDNGGVLAIGDTWTYTCTVENVLMSFVNAATVNAEGCTSGTPVDDTDVSPVIVPSPPSIPTVGQWGLIILGLMMSIVAIIGIRQRAIEESTT